MKMKKVKHAICRSMLKAVSKYAAEVEYTKEADALAEDMHSLVARYYQIKASLGKNYKEIIARGDYREVKILFYNLSENEREDAERLYFDLYKGKLDEGPVNPETLVLKYGTDEEVLKFVSTGDVGRKTEEFLIEKCDREKISAYLKNKRVFSVSDQLASVVISMGLVELLVTKNLSDKMARSIVETGEKEILLQYAERLSSVGVQKILDRKDLSLTTDEKCILIKMRSQKNNFETQRFLLEVNR